MPNHRLHQTLSQALDAPDNAYHLARYVVRFHHQNSGRLISQHSETVLSLKQMLSHYVTLLPLMAKELQQCCQHPLLQIPVNRLITIINEFFETIDSPRLNYGLVGVLDKAYFGHRLFEEFHDRLRLQTGQPMIQWDLALASVIVHSFIGDKYANQLDMVVMEIIDSLALPEVDWSSSRGALADDFHCLATHHGLHMVLS